MKNKEKKQVEKVKLRQKIFNKVSNTLLFLKVKELLNYLNEKIKQSIQFELMIAFAICFAIALCTYLFTNGMFRDVKTYSKISYNYDGLENEAKNIVDNIEGEGKKIEVTIKSNKYFHDLFDGRRSENAKVYITDLEGNVLQKTNNVTNEKIDIFSTLKNIGVKNSEGDEAGEYTVLYPISIDNGKYYLIYQGLPTAYIDEVVYEVSNSFLALVISFIVFIIAFLVVTNKKMKYLHEIATGMKIIAHGDLGYHIEERGDDEVSTIAKNVNIMAKEINEQIEAQKASEKTKSDLITNVSHDLRTPLTSIMGYIGLIKDKRYETDKDMEEYLNIAYNKSEKLKILIEDLFEYTKLNNDGLQLNKSEVNLVDFVSQISEEMKPYFESEKIDQVMTLSDEKIIVSIDVNKMVRVMENLFTNAVKYSYKPGAVIVGVYAKDGYATIAVKNRGENIPQAKLDKLFDRFYRLDESRSAELGGSGLGLAITKNIVEKHGGRIWAECYGNDISFYVRLKL